MHRNSSVGRAAAISALTAVVAIVGGCGGFTAKTRTSFEGDEAYSRVVIPLPLFTSTVPGGLAEAPSMIAYAESRLFEAMKREGLMVVEEASATARTTLVVRLTIDITGDAKTARPVTGVGASKKLLVSTLSATDFATNQEKLRSVYQSGPDGIGGDVQEAARKSVDALVEAFDLGKFVAN